MIKEKKKQSMIMASLSRLNRPNLLYISSTQSARAFKGNAFLYFQFEDFKTFQLLKACVHYFSLFLKDKCISSLVRTKYIERKFNLVVFSSHCFTNIYSLLLYHALPASLKLLV